LGNEKNKMWGHMRQILFLAVLAGACSVGAASGKNFFDGFNPKDRKTALAYVKSRTDALMKMNRKSSEFKKLIAVIRKNADEYREGNLYVNKNPELAKYVLLMDELNLRLPPEMVKAVKFADFFPGKISANAKVVKKTIDVDTVVKRWHATGLYARPGMILDIKVSGIPKGKRYYLKVGCHRDNVWQRYPKLKRYPRITRTFKLRNGKQKAACAFGGPIFIEIPKHLASKGRIKVAIDGAVEMPYFKLAERNKTNWRRELAKPAPWGIIVGENIWFILPKYFMKKIKKPVDFAVFWDGLVGVQDKLCGYTRVKYPEICLFDRQLRLGYMHSGYPFMVPLSAIKQCMPAYVKARGAWGFLHELGHNHQYLFPSKRGNSWTFDKNIEVTVNLFSAYTCVTYLKNNATLGANGYWNPNNLSKWLKKDYKPGIVYAEGSHRYRSMFFAHLVAEFGWDSIQKCLSSYWEIPAKKHPTEDNDAKRDLFLIQMSKAAGVNLTSFFNDWGVATSKNAQAKVKYLPLYSKYKYPLPKAQKS
jgi:hypothetical protein